MGKESEPEKMEEKSEQEKMGEESKQGKIGKESEQDKMGEKSEQEKMGEKEQEEVKVKRKKKDGDKVSSTKPKKVKGDDILKELEKFRYAFNEGVCVPESQCPVITCILLLTHYFLFFRRKVT